MRVHLHSSSNRDAIACGGSTTRGDEICFGNGVKFDFRSNDLACVFVGFAETMVYEDVCVCGDASLTCVG